MSVENQIWVWLGSTAYLLLGSRCGVYMAAAEDRAWQKTLMWLTFTLLWLPIMVLIGLVVLMTGG